MTKIAFITIGDGTSINCWSGTPFHMAQALKDQGNEVVHVGPLKAPLLPFGRLYSKLRQVAGLPDQSPLQMFPVVKQYAKDAAHRIKNVALDVVFAPAGSAFAWNTPKNIPLVYTSDATFRLIHGYHPNYRNMSEIARLNSSYLERLTIARADLLLYPSQWAADSTIRDYGADPKKVHVIPWGANLKDIPSRESVLGPRKPGPLRLLFVGNNWVEKGAETAIATLNGLRYKGIETELVICGCTPPDLILPLTGLTIIPYLDKKDPAQAARLDQLYRNADFFILPTRADCYGIVFCEAAAYGVPSIAPDTGGVSGAIKTVARLDRRDDENGLLMPPDANASDYADVIQEALSSPSSLKYFKTCSRNAFETRLNWQVWGKQVSSLIEKL